MNPSLDPSLTLGEVATRHPSSIAVLERLGLDYCCKGRRTLEAACQERGLSLTEVLSAISSEATRNGTAPPTSWIGASMTMLADHIEGTHHAYARDALFRLEETCRRVVAAHAAHHPELNEISELITRLAADLRDHMVREERVLFPWLRRLERPTEIQSGPPWSVSRPIGCMVHDHDDVSALFDGLRGITNGYLPPEDACASYRSLMTVLRELEHDTHVHIHKENNILFPAGLRAEQARNTFPSRSFAATPSDLETHRTRT